MGLADVAPAVYTTILYVVENGLTILVPSSSSLAALTMPIFGPLTELVGLNPEGAVTALCLAEPMMTHHRAHECHPCRGSGRVQDQPRTVVEDLLEVVAAHERGLHRLHGDIGHAARRLAYTERERRGHGEKTHSRDQRDRRFAACGAASSRARAREHEGRGVREVLDPRRLLPGVRPKGARRLREHSARGRLRGALHGGSSGRGHGREPGRSGRFPGRIHGPGSHSRSGARAARAREAGRH